MKLVSSKQLASYKGWHIKESFRSKLFIKAANKNIPQNVGHFFDRLFLLAIFPGERRLTDQQAEIPKNRISLHQNSFRYDNSGYI